MYRFKRAKVQDISLPVRNARINRLSCQSRKSHFFSLLPRSSFSPRRNFFNCYTSRDSGAERGHIVPETSELLRSKGQEAALFKRRDGGGDCGWLRSAVTTTEREQASHPASLHHWLRTRTPPTFPRRGAAAPTNAWLKLDGRTRNLLISKVSLWRA